MKPSRVGLARTKVQEEKEQAGREEEDVKDRELSKQETEGRFVRGKRSHRVRNPRKFKATKK